MKMKAVFIPLFLSLTACATLPSDLSKQNTFTPEGFSGNPRIEMRDMMLEPIQVQHNKSLPYKKKNRTQKIVFKSTEKPMQSEGSIKEIYGSSINDSFNGISHAYISQMTMPASVVPVEAVQSAKAASLVSARPRVAPLVSEENHERSDKNINEPPGTNYVPLTFPIPPPQDMMKQFHMQVGSHTVGDS